ncbi:MAG: hypothetical protein KBT20_02335 [Bacteroidales bacterium]|nr:hypothetical protein [Candidatus Liminaster caballi]
MIKNILTAAAALVCSTAMAIDLEPTPTQFTTTTAIDGTYNVKLVTLADIGIDANVVNFALDLMDPNGQKVTDVMMTLQGYNLTFTVLGAPADSPYGTYSIPVPAGSIQIESPFGGILDSDPFTVSIIFTDNPDQGGDENQGITTTFDFSNLPDGNVYDPGDMIQTEDGLATIVITENTNTTGNITRVEISAGAATVAFAGHFMLSAAPGYLLKTIEFTSPTSSPGYSLYDLELMGGFGELDNYNTTATWTGSAAAVGFSVEENRCRVRTIDVTLAPEEGSGIEDVADTKKSLRHVTVDLTGRIVSPASTGIVIIDGKKILNK